MEQKGLVRTLVAERVKLLGYIQFLVRRDDLAEDIFQEVCTLAVEKCAQIKDESHLLMWLRTTARLQSMNAVRKHQQRPVSLDDGLLDLLELDWQEQDQYRSSLRTAALDYCLELLPEKSRQLIRRRYFQGADYVRLADEMKRPVNSLYVTFSRIYATLAQCIAGKLAVLEESSG